MISGVKRPLGPSLCSAAEALLWAWIGTLRLMLFFDTRTGCAWLRLLHWDTQVLLVCGQHCEPCDDVFSLKHFLQGDLWIPTLALGKLVNTSEEIRKQLHHFNFLCIFGTAKEKEPFIAKYWKLAYMGEWHLVLVDLMTPALCFSFHLLCIFFFWTVCDSNNNSRECSWRIRNLI